ncbi:MAG: hypothetical protein A2Z20_07365 [Bdellovibrionales bacterium RBG_16_40_8]|nr:MAG: hypothetical protein A2Z20_07365 [Bdellovibrionales bacterium RBG_16_40_8]
MKVHYDEKSDAVYIRLDDKQKIIESKEVESGVILDFDVNGKVIGVEILNVKDRIGSDQLKELKFQVAN